ncbi:MAG: hypothetical protein CSA54_02070, partial [Gammaproteobacteria bacterium]
MNDADREALLAALSAPMTPAANDFSLLAKGSLALVILLLLALGWLFWRWHQRRAWRREARRELRHLRESLPERP